MILNKKRWFRECLLKYEIFYHCHSRYGDNYSLIEYAPPAPRFIHRHNIDEIIKITHYFEKMPDRDRFFEARKVALKHKKEKRKNYLCVYYETKKQRQKELAKLL